MRNSPGREADTMSGRGLEGLQVLIIEDEALIAMLIEDLLVELGGSAIKTATASDEAANCIASLAFDIAILDVNLRGQVTYPLADMLREKGIPFVFATGYGADGIPERFGSVPILQKPFDTAQLEQALLAARRGP
jgi:CheY-like chemotaxis protein